MRTKSVTHRNLRERGTPLFFSIFSDVRRISAAPLVFHGAMKKLIHDNLLAMGFEAAASWTVASVYAARYYRYGTSIRAHVDGDDVVLEVGDPDDGRVFRRRWPTELAGGATRGFAILMTDLGALPLQVEYELGRLVLAIKTRRAERWHER